MLSLQSLFWVAILFALGYLVGKRVEEKRNETFEDRDF